jgi:outer membrane protein TolC
MFSLMDSICRMKGKLIIALLLIVPFVQLSAQQRVPGNRRRDDSLISLRHNPPNDSIIQSRLVMLVLQGPRYEAATHQVNVASEQLASSKRTWLNLLSLSANFNEFDFPGASQPQNSQYVYPKYLVGVTIPIGLFFEMGPQIKAARENVMVIRSNQEDLARSLRMQVLSQYANYKNYSALITLENTVLVDQQAAMNQIEEKFRGGSVTIEQYNTANRAYTDERVKMLNLQLSQDQVRLDIERMIGVSFDTVIK